MSTTPQPGPTVQQNAATPPGNIPKGRQTYIMIGVALVIVLSIVFSGSANSPKPVKLGANLPPLNVNTPSKGDIDAFAKQLSEAAAQEKQAQAEAARLKEAVRQATAQGVPAPNTGLQGGIPGQPIIGPDGKAYYPVPMQNQTASAPVPVNPVVQEKEKMEYASLFASPVALSLRPSVPAAMAGPGVSPSSNTVGRDSALAAAPAVPQAPVLPASPAIPAAVAPPSAPPAVAPSYVAAVDRVPVHVLFEGTILEAVLTNRLAGSFAGPVNCMVTTNVYSHDHNLLMIPQGSRVLGEAKRVAEQAQQRLAVVFHRIIMPDGYSVNLDQFLGLDQAGATGLKDRTDHHYLEVFGTSIALGVLSGFSQFGTGSALTAGGLDSYRQGVAGQLAQNSSSILSRQLNRLPDITIREGQRVKIILMKDLELPAYAAHQGRNDL